MYLLLFLVVLCVVYIASFKTDFNQEQLSKVAPVVIAIVAITLVLCLFSVMIKS
jgi:hypothetical protein